LARRTSCARGTGRTGFALDTSGALLAPVTLRAPITLRASITLQASFTLRACLADNVPLHARFVGAALLGCADDADSAVARIQAGKKDLGLLLRGRLDGGKRE
jgi:hypothetical protein